ncbi:pentapeptide repeat-containing protein [Nocardioides anomalus]|uniref:Pentapeptide repeat-containing protein n=1 Tax=Nocardioides anomalus TaxID=2712223 RepID=A0A6G6WD37_9ACTN|nr:pentapeptide repeat-containing protein [Nocardioides anomalus]QIG43261.1 pentapeptide repeat-containing protein [Nocardioides anomalus]
MSTLAPDCSRCVGLCCVALPFRESAGFAFAKDAGEPCRHLGSTYACRIHAELLQVGMSGCTTYECFGAGQHVTQEVYAGASWRDDPEGGAEMFEVFAVVQRLHEMLVLLDQAAALVPSPALAALRAGVDRQRSGTSAEILDTELDLLQAHVGAALREVSATVREDGPSYAGQDWLGRDLRGTDLARAELRGALLVAADLRDCVLDRTDLLGADLRDADVSGADLSTTLFLTQPQLNAARGSATTALPPGLRRPAPWV